MEWTQQKLARYIGRVRTVVEFEGITGDELERAFQQEAMRRLLQIEETVYNKEMTQEEKIEEVEKALHMEQA